MSDTSEVSGATSRANRALGDRRADVIAAVEQAKADVAAKKLGAAPTPEERRDIKAVDRPKVGEAADKAMGKSREEAVEVVEAAAEALAQPPTEPEPASKPAAAETREGRLLTELRAREKKLVDGQGRLRREREELDNYKRRVETELAEARESQTLAQRDPFAWFERYHGIKRSAFGVAGQADPGPNVALEQAMARIDKLEKERAARDAADQERARSQARDRELDKFVTDARAGASRWPLASRYAPEKLRSQGWDIAVAAAKEGVTLSNDEVLDRIEEHLSEIASLRAPKSPAASKPKSTETDGSEEHLSQQPTLAGRGVTDAEPTARSPLGMKRSDMIRETVRALEELRDKAGKK